MADDGMSNDEGGFDYEAALRAAGLSAPEGDEDEHARKAEAEYRDRFRTDSSTVFVDPDGTAHYADMEFPEGVDSRSFGEDVEDAEIVKSRINPAGRPIDEKVSTEVIGTYKEKIEQWNNGFSTSSDAYTVAGLQSDRVAAMQEIMANGLTHHPDLKGLERFIAADIAWISRPDPRDGEYADYIKHRNRVRMEVFSEKDDDNRIVQVNDTISSADDYARATGAISQAMVAKLDVEQHYEFLAVRQEAALEHFNDPRFVAEVGLYARNRIDDELLVDFDRWDLRDPTAKKRSQVMADAFAESIDLETEVSTTAKIESFQKMRETGRSVSHNQDSIMRFARMTRKGPDGSPPKIDERFLEAGLQALDNKVNSPSVTKEWLDSIPRAERKMMKDQNTPVGLMRKARETFERDFDALAKGRSVDGSTLAASFAVMENAAQEILKNYPLHNKNNQLNNPEDLGCLAMFSAKYRESTLDKIPEKIDEVVFGRLTNDNLLNEGSKTGFATRQPKSRGGEEYHLDLDAHGDRIHIEVADGNHLRLSNSRQDAEAGKFVQLRLEGLTVPEMGQQTKSGALDAGLEAKSHIEGLVARYGADKSVERMGLQIENNSNGEPVLKATMPSGESLSQRMIRDGYGLPTHESEGITRRENLAKQAESFRRGLWKEGFPEVDRTWRTEDMSPSLSAKDKRERLADMVGLSMAMDTRSVTSKLSHRETKIFSLPLEAWAAHSNVDEAVMKVARTNPGRLQDIYENNLEILKDLRKRKDKLTPAEKVAHDRLDMGRRAIGKPLAELGHMDPEKVQKDGHAMMSRKGIKANLDALRPFGNAAAVVADTTTKYVGEGIRRAPGALKTLLDIADER